jgi:hypothetical protein
MDVWRYLRWTLWPHLPTAPVQATGTLLEKSSMMMQDQNMYVTENSVIHKDSAAPAKWMADFSDRSMWMTELSVTFMFWSCDMLGYSMYRYILRVCSVLYANIIKKSVLLWSHCCGAGRFLCGSGSNSGSDFFHRIFPKKVFHFIKTFICFFYRKNHRKVL